MAAIYAHFSPFESHFFLATHTCVLAATSALGKHTVFSMSANTIGSYGLGNGCLAADSLKWLVPCLFPALLCFHSNVA